MYFFCCTSPSVLRKLDLREASKHAKVVYSGFTVTHGKQCPFATICTNVLPPLSDLRQFFREK